MSACDYWVCFWFSKYILLFFKYILLFFKRLTLTENYNKLENYKTIKLSKHQTILDVLASLDFTLVSEWVSESHAGQSFGFEAFKPVYMSSCHHVIMSSCYHVSFWASQLVSLSAFSLRILELASLFLGKAWPHVDWLK